MRLLMVFLALLAVSAPAQAQSSGAGCRVERLAASPALREATGGLGNPPNHLAPDEIARMATCLTPALDRTFAAVGDPAIRRVRDWAAMSRTYKASEHGTFLQVFAEPQAARSYRQYEAGPAMEQGAVLVKRAFRVDADGRARPYRVYVMEKRAPGAAPGTNDWRFAAYEPDGSLVGETGGRNDARVRFCAACHAAARAQDFLLFVPPAFRLPTSAAAPAR